MTRDMHGDKVTVLVNFLNHLTIERVSVIFHVKGGSKSLKEFVLLRKLTDLGCLGVLVCSLF